MMELFTSVGSIAKRRCSNREVVVSIAYLVFALCIFVLSKEFHLLNGTAEISGVFDDAIKDRSKNLTKSYELDYESCKASGVDSLVPENWCLDSNNVPRYVGKEDWPPRNIHRYTHGGYEKCLGNKTLVFIGDSRVRYQFMSLASYLQSKEFMKCEDYSMIAEAKNITFSPDPKCFLVNERFLNISWNQWYEDTTAEFPGSLCDCYRSNKKGFKPDSTFENRFFKKPTPFGEITLVYIQNFLDDVTMNKHFPPFTSFEPNPQRCKPGNCLDRTIGFQGNLSAILWNIVPKFNPTHVFANSGWTFVDYSCEVRDFSRHYPGIKSYLISHPSMLEKVYNPSLEFDATKLQCDSDLIDRTAMTKNVPKNWYWDRAHVLSILNEEWNHLLVGKICPIKTYY
ncbi:unnamed protein product [Pseudo-nitzschia multistriata]|uniref:Uncharacterized protein n=1 Tax=Pseudo-nitzschia multistriata TaxID=183589 RepID=A0A448Z2Y9_9STRA|nr:unnamed protein product [Pseudo-nitzschia multistriata]